MIILYINCVASGYHEIQQLLKVSFAHGCSQEPNSSSLRDSYILLLNINILASQSAWTGQTIEITAPAETTINLLELQASRADGVVILLLLCLLVDVIVHWERFKQSKMKVISLS